MLISRSSGSVTTAAQRAAGATVLGFVLAACSSGGPAFLSPAPKDPLAQIAQSDTPFAPTVKPGASAENPRVIGYRLLEASQPELALKSFQRAAATEGLTTELISAFGSANLALGRLNQAETLMRRATTAQDATPADWNNLGVVLMERDKTAESVQILKKAFALSNGEDTEIRDNLRLALAKMENTSYADLQEQDYKLVRRGASDFALRKTPG